MERVIYMEGKPVPRYGIMCSLPVNLFTEMIFVDYAANKFHPPTNWSKEMAQKLNEEDQRLLQSIRSILAHGWILRDFVLKKCPIDHPVHKDWSNFIGWLENLTKEEMIELTIDGIISGLDYYHQFLDPIHEVEEILEELGPQAIDATFLKDESNRRKALTALLASWKVKDKENTTNMIMAIEPFHDNIVTFIKTLWEKGYKEEWERKREFLQRAMEGVRPLLTEKNDTEDMIIRITGIKPRQEVHGLQDTREVIFIPCLHLGENLAIFSLGDTSYVLYEPNPIEKETKRPAGTPPNDQKVVEILTAIGDETRLNILLLLKKHPGLHAIQIGDMLDLHPSTVSRACQVLVNAGILSGKKEQGFKCFYINEDWVDILSTWLLKNFKGSSS